MLLFRITKESRLETYNGLGASYQDGARWNHAGTPVLYFGLSASVAMLEMANYTPSPRVPASFRLGIYEIPAGAPIARLDSSDFPVDWDSFPYPVATQEIGDNWLKQGKQFGLIVPSAAVAMGLDEIIIVNPLHDAAREIKLIDSTDKIYNPRAFMASS